MCYHWYSKFYFTLSWERDANEVDGGFLSLPLNTHQLLHCISFTSLLHLDSSFPLSWESRNICFHPHRNLHHAFSSQWNLCHHSLFATLICTDWDSRVASEIILCHRDLTQLGLTWCWFIIISSLLLYSRFFWHPFSIPLCPQLPVWVQQSHHHLPNCVAFEFFFSLLLVYLSFCLQ